MLVSGFSCILISSRLSTDTHSWQNIYKYIRIGEWKYKNGILNCDNENVSNIFTNQRAVYRSFNWLKNRWNYIIHIKNCSMCAPRLFLDQIVHCVAGGRGHCPPPRPKEYHPAAPKDMVKCFRRIYISWLLVGTLHLIFFPFNDSRQRVFSFFILVLQFPD